MHIEIDFHIFAPREFTLYQLLGISKNYRILTNLFLLSP